MKRKTTIAVSTLCLAIIVIGLIIFFSGRNDEESAKKSFFEIIDQFGPIDKVTSSGPHDVLWIVDDPGEIQTIIELISDNICGEFSIDSTKELYGLNNSPLWQISLSNTKRNCGIGIDGDIHSPDYKIRLNLHDYSNGINDAIFFYEREALSEKILRIMYSGKKQVRQIEKTERERLERGPLQENEFVQMRVQEGSLSENGLTVKVTNNDNLPITIGNDYHVEENNKGTWIRHNAKADLLYYEESLIIEKGNEETFIIDWTDYYGSLSPGQYCLVKKYVHNGREYCARAEFELKE